MLEPAEPDRALAGARASALLAVAAMLGAGRLAGRRRHVAAVARAAPADRADADGRARARRAVLPGRLERAGRRHLARHLRPARRARALPRPRRLGAHGDPARRHRARAARRACWRSGRAAAGSASRAPALLVAGRALRRPGGRDRLRRRVPPRRGLHAADGRLPAAGEAAPPGRAGAPPRSPWLATLVALGRRARAQPRHAVVRLRDVGARDVVVEVDLVHAGTTPTAGSTGRATAASCCA